ncbi:hypothetical protein PC129_g17904 [Phytophthora cactorum]|uniref:RxLR effector protein n=1 Tax=Phytophthora cactorum TaxID=29920 RepID=A0A329RYF6_9STRA|nr:hypothetical protein Pcac1_g15088 [Phytophthora cactorum]KAG2820229.1 hypothetical protein PC112_g11844 [Phytophthora cactorum]KAG2821153.1 hypothetical protein PC111_g11145 [Phytophthora cactorum]KAG2856949.1 hypothetical protein PC113_g11121 [Phytophthora cactorum]KAG2907161.1 hypothetical protein PC114_g10912 [Phytophthora cactorum]
MRLTYVLVLLEAAVIATLYATDASDVTLSGLNMANAVVLANDQENFGNHRRFLRTYKEDVATADDEDDHDQDKKNDDEEERMFSGWKDKLKAAGTVAKLSRAKSFNLMPLALKNIDDAGELKALFSQFKPLIKNKQLRRSKTDATYKSIKTTKTEQHLR